MSTDANRETIRRGFNRPLATLRRGGDVRLRQESPKLGASAGVESRR
jgi:hypothetical protein